MHTKSRFPSRRNSAFMPSRRAVLHASARTLWICATTAAPSPTAAATRFVEPARTSPMANTPGRFVSSGNARRGPGLRPVQAIRARDEEPLAIDPHTTLEPGGIRVGANEQKEMPKRTGMGRPCRALAKRRRSEARNLVSISAAISVPVCRITFGNAAIRSIR